MFNYHRRGRGRSGDTPPYAVDREVEDIAAVAGVTGGAALLYGASSGAVLALEAARQRPGVISRLVMWEPPFILDPVRRPPADTARIYRDLVAADRRGDAAEYFMAQVVGMPPEFVAGARNQPWWSAQEAPSPHARIRCHRHGRLLAAWGAHPRGYGSHPGAGRRGQLPVDSRDGREVAHLLPQGQHRTLEGQQHNVDAAVLAPALQAFFNA